MNNTQAHCVRLFFAVLPDDSLKAIFAKLIHSLKKRPICHDIRWVTPDNLHLTLHFIGKTPVDKVSPLIDRIQQKITQLPAFDLNLGHLILFPPSHHPHILAVSIKPSLPLLQLVATIIQSVADTDLVGDKRTYMPHITLGKVRRLVFIDNFRKNIHLPLLPVQQITLLQSQLTINGAEYHLIKQFALSCN